ncbi:MAG: ATP-binding cassette domain-containing protein [Candidatus Nitrosopelagicus sp.]|nr:ATP-binding cassette domain-containing protein [Candidatus Nitrosopelagicus sp.]
MGEILRVEDLNKNFTKKGIFQSKSDTVTAAKNVNFSLNHGEIIAIAGQSGSGKSTIAKLILRAIEPDSGKIFFDGKLSSNNSADLKKLRMKCQMVYQDPYDAVNPRMKISDIINEPLEIHNIGNKETRFQMVLDVLKEVKLEPVHEIAKKYPHMLSGGQRQRVVIARALVVKPKVIIADEPVSMLDVSIRAEILELLDEIQKQNQISIIYITHDLATAKHFAHRIIILYEGIVVEAGTVDAVLTNPRHPYTQALIDAISEPDPKNLYKEKKIMWNTDKN